LKIISGKGSGCTLRVTLPKDYAMA
jgi:hypothetical protein